MERSLDPNIDQLYSLCVVCHQGRYVLVNERKTPGRWYIPGGRLEKNESFLEAAIREAQEEAGISIKLESVLKLDYIMLPNQSTRARIFFFASPVESTQLKCLPDEESLGAEWVYIDEMGKYPLRDPEVISILKLAAGSDKFLNVEIVERVKSFGDLESLGSMLAA